MKNIAALFASTRPLGKFGAIVADPGTKFDVRSRKGITSRSAETKYTTLTDEELMQLPVGDLAMRDCHLFYWDTSARLVAGRHIPIMKAWGFTPSAMAFVWVKTNKNADPRWLNVARSFPIGTGYTTRKNAEFCILGRRGSPQRWSKSVRELLIAARREHSRKPEEFYERVMSYCEGPYVDLFSRTSRVGWSTWGDEAGRWAA